MAVPPPSNEKLDGVLLRFGPDSPTTLADTALDEWQMNVCALELILP
jgi:hypothetical protein